MMTTKSKESIALVLIHGIGEQRPMATLRGFVKDIFGQPGQSKPDRLATQFEVRRLNIEVDQSRIECRELYWAHLIESTAWIHVGKWLWRLVMTSGAELRKMAHHLDPGLYTRTRRVTVEIVLLGLLLVIWAWLKGWGWWSLPAPLALFLGFAFAAFDRQVLVVVGDAARYLDNAPANIGIRQAVRTECVRFLEELNSSPEFSRIVVIGHSLGSVIAYDALRLLWAKQEPHAAVPDSPANRQLLAWLHGSWKPKGESASSPQRALFERLFSLDTSKQPAWKISDLVTVGSPLTHAPLLFAGSMEDFLEMKAQREYPSCPPVQDKESGACGWFEDGRFNLHHAAAFAVVHWTNLFFPSDPIGGPMRAVFGAGIHDVPLLDAPRRSWRDHVRYWGTGKARGSAEFKEVVRQLIFEQAGRQVDRREQVKINVYVEELVLHGSADSASGSGGAGI